MEKLGNLSVKSELEKFDILSMTQGEIESAVKNLGQPTYRAKQIWGWLHQKHVQTFADMPNLPKSMRDELDSAYRIASVVAEKKLTSKTDGTVKYLFSLHDSTLIESVLMEYSHGNTVCISTQAGCRMGCTFCASAEGGLVRNLTAGEMCIQVYAAARDCSRVGGIVLMGCGEPLDNFDQTMRFIELITHKEGINIGQRHITLSTCGLVPQIHELAEMKLQITLAISLHGATDDVRQQLVPIAKRYPINDLISACRNYIEKTNRRITFEYTLADGINDNISHAKDLTKLLRGLNCHVNLIPINKARGEFSPSTRKNTQEFVNILEKGRIQTTVRRSLGSDVNAACGQLRSEAKTHDKK